MQTQALEKTFHRWTEEEDKKLIAEVAKNKDAYALIGKPGGITRDLFWGQIPGRISVLATPVACAMRYRTLTSDTEWAKKRRAKAPEAPTKKHDGLGEIVEDLAEIREMLKEMLDIWRGKETTH